MESHKFRLLGEAGPQGSLSNSAVVLNWFEYKDELVASHEAELVFVFKC